MENVNFDWCEELYIRLQAQQSNIVIINSTDYLRINQLIKFINDKFSNAELYLFDVSTQKLFLLQIGIKQEINVDGSPLQKIDSLLRRKDPKTFVIIINAYLQHYINYIVDYLLHWSHDSSLFAFENKVFVFSDSSLFPTLIRRLSINIEPPISTVEERQAIIAEIIKKLGITDNNITEAVNITAGLNLYEVATATYLSIYKTKSLSAFEYRQYKTEILNHYGIEFIQPIRGFESIGGYDFLKNYIKQNIILPLKNPEMASKYGISVPKGMILFGPPGTGKTYFVIALAKEVSLPLLQLDPSTFLRGIVGETEQRIKQIQQIVESLAPCILFIDEIDQLFMSRERIVSTDSGVSARMISMLLSWFGDEKRKSIIIGTTNFIERIDEAFLRPGRIDTLIPVLYPDYDARLQILQVHANNKPVDSNALVEIAKRTFLYTSAELAHIVEKALRKAFIKNSVATYEMLEEAMLSLQVDVEERKRVLQRYKALLKTASTVDLEIFNMQVSKLSKEMGTGVIGRGI